LKKQYKEKNGNDWKPAQTPIVQPTQSTPQPEKSGSSPDSLSSEIEAQGQLVRDLKAKDPKSQESKDAIQRLLELKKKFKEQTGNEWKPAQTFKPTPSSSDGITPIQLSHKIEAQGTQVRELKAKDAKSAETKEAIAKLLELKKEYKTLTGSEWKPPVPVNSEVKPAVGDDLYSKVEAQGQLVRDLKAKDSKSAETKEAIQHLLELKKEYKDKTGKDYKPGQK